MVDIIRTIGAGEGNRTLTQVTLLRILSQWPGFPYLL